MSKKALYYDEALRLYVEEFYSFEAIAKKLPITSRTLQLWAKKSDWATRKKVSQRTFDDISQDNKIIARLLGKRIKELLSCGEEPSATVLNAFSRAVAIALNVKRFEVDTDDGREDLPKRSIEDIINENLS